MKLQEIIKEIERTGEIDKMTLNTQRHFYEYNELNKLKEVSESHHSKIYLYEFNNDVKYYISRGMNKEESERYVKYWYALGIENLKRELQ